MAASPVDPNQNKLIRSSGGSDESLKDSQLYHSAIDDPDKIGDSSSVHKATCSDEKSQKPQSQNCLTGFLKSVFSVGWRTVSYGASYGTTGAIRGIYNGCLAGGFFTLGMYVRSRPDQVGFCHTVGDSVYFPITSELREDGALYFFPGDTNIGEKFGCDFETAKVLCGTAPIVLFAGIGGFIGGSIGATYGVFKGLFGSDKPTDSNSKQKVD